MKRLFRQDGMSLISTLMAAGIVSVVAMTIMQVVLDGIRGQRHVQQRQAALNVQSAALDLLADRATCTANFTNLNSTLTTPIAGGLKNASGTVLMALNAPLENNMVQITAISLGTLRRRANAGVDRYRGAMTLAMTINRIGEGLGPAMFVRNVELAVIMNGYVGGAGDPDLIISCVAVGNDSNNPWVSTPELNIVYQGNNVGIGVNVPSQKLQVNGNILAASFLYPSDARLKENIRTVEGLDRVSRLRGVEFTWRESGKLALGMIAQEVESQIPSAVTIDPVTGLKAIDYVQIIPLLVESTKQLRKENEDLRASIRRLERVSK